MYEILLLKPSHKLQSISTCLLQFSKIFTGSLSLNGLSIKFLLTFKTIMNGQPSHLHQLLIPQTHYSLTRSSRTSAPFIPRTRTLTGKCAFSVAATGIWNSLPAVVCTTTSVSSFRSKLKTHFFKIAFPP